MSEASTGKKLKPCPNGCGKTIFWDPEVSGKRKFVETSTRILHTLGRCQNLLEQQGKSLDVFALENNEDAPISQEAAEEETTIKNKET